MKSSLTQRILNSNKPFTFFHTWTVSEELLQRAIREEKSMDLDVCVDNDGKPYLGHSKEYHEKSGEPYFNSLPIWEVVDRISKSNIFAMVDCKHYDAWPVIEKVVTRIGPERCLVCVYVSEFKFNFGRKDDEPDFLTEWSPIEKLCLLKSKFPLITITPCAKWLPNDLLISDQYEELISKILKTLKNNHADTVCLGVPDDTISDKWLEYFLEEKIIPHVVVDKTDVTRLSEMYIGETDYLDRASKITDLQ